MARSVLVTGGGTGIGRAVAAAFAAEGDDVIVTGRRSGLLEQAAAESGVRSRVCDASDPYQVEELSLNLPTRIDVLINNAGGNTGFDRDDDKTLAGVAAGWRANIEANVLSAVLTTTAVQDRLAEGGAVISLGSIGADQGSGSYGAAKAALASWNVGLAKDLGRRGITANIVSPGFIADTEFFRGRADDAFRRSKVAANAVGRMGVPDDIARTVVFLASQAGRHISGQVINVNGGEHMTR